MNDKIPYPCAIIPDRYGGTYVPGHFPWLAFKLYGNAAEELDCTGGDTEAVEFWHTFKGPYGAGNTPDEALEALKKALAIIELE